VDAEHYYVSASIRLSSRSEVSVFQHSAERILTRPNDFNKGNAMIKVIIASLILIGAAHLNALAESSSNLQSFIALKVEARQGPAGPEARVTIINTTTRDLYVPDVEPRELITVIVGGASRKLVLPTKTIMHTHSYNISAPLKLMPGQRYIVGSARPEFNDGWISLAGWGYPDVSKGLYTVTTRLGVYFGGRADVKPYTAEERQARPNSISNMVTIINGKPATE